VRLGTRHGVEEHVNDQVEVIVLRVSGSGFVAVDRGEHALSARILVFIPKGARRSTVSASEYFAYLTPTTVGGDHRRLASGKARSLRKLMESTLRHVDSGRQGRDPPKGESMKRHPSLREFSDDHHQGLVHARRLRKAASGGGDNSADTARKFLEFWQRDTSLHFRKEEEVLLPVLARYGGDLGEQPLVQMLVQHARIRGLVMQLSDDLEQNKFREDTLRNLGEQLEAHIRLEERHVFPLIEQTLPEHALQEVAYRLDVFEPGPPHEPWVPAEGFSFDPWPGPGDSEGGGSD
jgi:hemerythrin-like domain-containing protein